jgi:hypothetical protein
MIVLTGKQQMTRNKFQDNAHMKRYGDYMLKYIDVKHEIDLPETHEKWIKTLLRQLTKGENIAILDYLGVKGAIMTALLLPPSLYLPARSTAFEKDIEIAKNLLSQYQMLDLLTKETKD